jgi:hypothetical protein
MTLSIKAEVAQQKNKCIEIRIPLVLARHYGITQGTPCIITFPDLTNPDKIAYSQVTKIDKTEKTAQGVQRMFGGNKASKDEPTTTAMRDDDAPEQPPSV